MGWTCYNRNMTEAEALAELRTLGNFTNSDGSRSTVLADGITGSGENRGYYAAVRVERAGKAPLTYCLVCLITLRPFGYKDMSEDMGPNIDNAPRHVLAALDPLPPLDPKPCQTCGGSGQFNGRACFGCDGAGVTDRHTYARNWRARAWARHGGEPCSQPRPDALRVQLASAAPKRADAGAVIQRQHDCSALPLFEAATQPALF